MVKKGQFTIAVNNNKFPKRNVRLSNSEIKAIQHPVFSFEDFHLTSVRVENEFNNYYKNEFTFINTTTNLFGRGLQLLAHENVNELVQDKIKQNKMHFHPVSGKEEIIEKILNKYGLNKIKIDNILEGGNIYQFEIPYENGATRVIFQVIENVFSLLFLDANHHIYFNKKKVIQANSLFFETCPVNVNKQCPRMDYVGTCFAFEFLDETKIEETYGYQYKPTFDETVS